MFGGRFFRDFKPFSEEVSYHGNRPKQEHEWAEVKLLNLVAFNCKSCGCKKEDFEKNPDLPCLESAA